MCSGGQKEASKLICKALDARMLRRRLIIGQPFAPERGARDSDEASNAPRCQRRGEPQLKLELPPHTRLASAAVKSPRTL